jgi:hypothetical protein
MNDHKDIFGYIQSQEAAYKLPIQINEKWRWSMKEHILTTDLYTNSQLLNGKNEFTPVKNITRPILNLQHRTEDIEVKDVQIYVDNPDKYHLSFLVKKYHDDVFAQENNLDTFFDELNISRIDMGAGLSKQLNKPCPEVVPLQSIAFCDQTDMLSGPIGIKHFYSPDQLLDMRSKGWGKDSNGATASVEDLIRLCRDEKKQANTGNEKTPGRYIEVYEVHGNLPKRFSDPNDDSEEYETALFIVAFYHKQQSDDFGGIILYTAPEKKLPFKLIKRDNVYGRALGFGGAEELFEAQVWTNYAVIREQNMLDAAAVTVMGATGADSQAITQRNKIQDMKNLEIIDLGQGDLKQIDTFPRNAKLFENSIAQWQEHAKEMGGAQDPIQGVAPASGTPFASLQAQIQQAMGLHAYRRGIYAKHLEEIYRDWIIPHIQKKICEGTKFLSELSLQEMQMVAGALITNKVNAMIKEKILNGELISQQEIDQMSQSLQQQFSKRGNKHFIEILKGEFKDVDLGVKVSIAGKSKDLAGMVDKLTRVFQTVIANPYILKAPPIAQLFNKIIEASGLEPIDLSQLDIPSMPARRMTETVAYKDLVTPPNDTQKQFLSLAGIQAQEMFGNQPVTQ